MDASLRVTLTVALFACYFMEGLGSSLMPSARLDVADMIGVDFSAISFDFVTQLIGGVVGSAAAVVLFSLVGRQVVLIVSLFVMAVAVTAVPFVCSLASYLTTQLLFGFVISIIDVACTPWLLELWTPRDAPPYLQAMLFFSSLADAVAPLIEGPFLLSAHLATRNDRSSIQSHDMTDVSATRTRLWIPFFASGSAFAMIALFLVILYFCFPDKRDKEETRDAFIRDEITCDTKLVVMGCILSSLTATTLACNMNFVPVFAIGCGLSREGAAFLTSAMSAAFAGNRFVSIFVAFKSRPQVMIFSSLAILVTGNLMILAFARTSRAMLWTSVLVIGSGHSSLDASIASYLGQRMDYTTRISALLTLSSNICTNLVPLVIGNLMADDVFVLVYANIVLLGSSVSLFVIMCVIPESPTRDNETTVRASFAVVRSVSNQTISSE